MTPDDDTFPCGPASGRGAAVPGPSPFFAGHTLRALVLWALCRLLHNEGSPLPRSPFLFLLQTQQWKVKPPTKGSITSTACRLVTPLFQVPASRRPLPRADSEHAWRTAWRGENGGHSLPDLSRMGERNHMRRRPFAKEGAGQQSSRWADLRQDL